MNVRKSNLALDKPIRPNSTFIAMLLVLLSMLLFVQPAFAQTGIPPTNDNRPGGLPANGTCGVDGLGNYVKFTAGGGDGTGLIATATGGNGGTLTAIYNQTSSASGGTFQITSLTLNGEPLLIAEVIGGAGSKNPIWVFTPSILAPTPVLATNVDKNFSQFALCAYDAIAPFSLTKTVDSGSGSFTFDVVCKSPTSGVVLLTTTVTLDVTAGTPTTQQVFGNVPIGAICTATETGASPDIYDNDGPKSATVATATGAGVTINNTLKVGTLTLVKVVDNLGESGPGYLAVSDFPLTIGGNATTSGTPATVTAGSYTIAETSKPGYSVGSWSCTDGTSGTAGSTSATVNISAGENTTCTIVNTLIADPALTIDKVSSTTSFDAVGDVIDYTIVVANTGNVTLDSVTINDPGAELGICMPAYGTALAPGASMTCTATHEVVQADLDAGGFTNTACVNASGATEQCDDAVVPAEKKPALVIDKTSSNSNFSAVGDVINYTIVATNTGNVTLNGVTIDDPKVSGLSCVPDNGSALAPGASITCSATHRVTQEDLDAGSYANTACVDDGSGGAAATCDGATVPAVQDPSLAIVKSALPATYDSVGDVINYSYLVTNDGNVTLNGPFTVSDDKTTASCPATTSLAPGESITCTASYTITQSDLDAGSVTNTASASNDTVTSPTDEETVTADKMPALVIDKVAAEEIFAAVGDKIHYTIVATNTGNITLDSVTITDPNVTDLSCTPANGSELAPGASMTCTATHTVTQADIDVGHYINDACVDDGADGATKMCDGADVPADLKPHLAIEKTATETSFDAVGDLIQYSIVATNNGNVTLNNVTVTDPLVKDLSCTPANGASLAPGASMTCTATYTITQADLDAGSFANSACVDDGSGGATEECEPAVVPADKKPSLAIDKVATNADYDAVGDVIDYTIVATNTGNVTLPSVTIVDTQVSNLSCDPANGSELAPGASMTCSATHTITQADLDAGSYANNACVDDGTDGAAEMCDDATVPAVQNPSLAIDKVSSTTSFDAVGDEIIYTIVANNTGNVTLDSVTISDPGAVIQSCTPANGAELAPGASMTCQAKHIVTQEDLDAGGYTNSACVNASGAAEKCDDAVVPADKKPALEIDKVAIDSSFDAVDDVINYTIVATNTGNVTLNSVTISDLLVSDLLCNPANGSELAPGASMTCGAAHTVTQADLDAGSFANTACVDDGADGAAEMCDDATVPAVQNPSLALDKSASPSNYDSVGDVIVYSYLLTNNGNVTLDGPFTVSDDKIANVTCPATATLAPTASITCTANYTIKQTDLDAGSITNVASASNGTVTSPTDEVTITADQLPSLALDKSAAPTTYDSVGDVIAYSYLVTNTGNVTLSGPFTVSDNKIADVTCPATATLAPGISITCTASYTIKQTDLDAGSITNVASASNGTVTSPTDEATVTADQKPSLALDKSALPLAYDSVGDVIVYSYLVTNNGNVTLSGPFTVSDNKIATVTCPATATLAPGASITCTASYTITQSDLDAGSITNVASASNGTVTSPTDTATVTAGQNPALLITKSPDLQHVFVGELATFTIMVTNIGNVTLTDVNVTDPLSPSCNRTIGTMIPGATVEYTCTVSVTADFVNKATATGKDPKGNSVSDDDTATVDAQKASITINKQIAQSASGPWSDALNTIFAGTSVYYQFVVVNTGDVALSGITVNDPKLGGVMTCPKTTLAAGESMTCSVVGPITATYSNGSSVINTATVTGCADAAHCATDDDTAAYSASYWGFTPGFWKNHAKAGSRYMWSYTAYSPSQKVNTVFTIPGCISSKYGTNTLLQALGLKGGSTLNGAAEILLRAATASLLNASFHETYNHAVYLAGVGLVDNLANPTIVYWPYSSQQIIAMVNSALASCNRSTILQLAATLDGYNNGIHQTPWGAALTAAEVAALNVPDAAEGEEQTEETEAKFSIFLPTVLK